MYAKAKKLQIIEEVLKIKSERTLSALEDVLKSSKGKESGLKKTDFRKFSDIWTKDEAEEIKKNISKSVKQSILMTGSNILLDTNIVIELFKGNQAVANSFDKYGQVNIPFAVLGELYLGAYR